MELIFSSKLNENRLIDSLIFDQEQEKLETQEIIACLGSYVCDAPDAGYN